MRSRRRAWLGRLLPRRRRDEMLDDLEALYRQRVRDRGRVHAALRVAYEVIALHVWRVRARRTHLEVRPVGRPVAPVTAALQDLRYASRFLRATPGFSIMAIATLTLGIGASTSMFALVDGVLLQPLPIPEAERVVFVWEVPPRGGRTAASAANYVDWRDHADHFEHLAVQASWGGRTLMDGDNARIISGAQISANYLDALGIQPFRGRSFTPDDERAGAADVVLLSSNLWRTEFASDPDIVGRTIRLDNGLHTVIGVLPAELRALGLRRDVFAPIRLDEGDWLQYRGRHNVLVIGRLRAGYTLRAAQDQLDTIAAALALEYPQSNSGYGVRISGAKETAVGDAGRTLLLLLGAVAMLLMIACVNVTNLFLARGQRRVGEVALFSALGASRARIVGLLLAESLILAAAGGAAGVALSWATLDRVRAFVPADVPRLDQVALDASVVAFAVVVTVVTVMAVGVLPGLRLSRSLQVGRMRSLGGAASSPQGRRTGALLVGAEFALAMVLLVTAGLFLRSLTLLSRVDLGIRTAGIVSARISPGLRYVEPSELRQLYESIRADIGALPGVDAAAMTSHVPVAREGMNSGFAIEGGAAAGADGPQASFRVVSPGYFEVLDIPVVAGRTPTDMDDLRAPSRVAINQTAASRYFPEGALGRRISFTTTDADEPIWSEIIGVVADVRHFGPDSAPVAELYQPVAQATSTWRWFNRSLALVVRYQQPPTDWALAIRDIVRRHDPDVPVHELRTMQEYEIAAVSSERFMSRLLALFAAAALTLSAVGVYGVLSFQLGERTAEIGLRMALGARPARLLATTVRDGLRPALIGAAVGLVAAFILGRTARQLLFGVGPLDPLTVIAVIGTLGVVATVACLVPSLRALRLDPTAALRRGR